MYLPSEAVFFVCFRFMAQSLHFDAFSGLFLQQNFYFVQFPSRKIRSRAAARLLNKIAVLVHLSATLILDVASSTPPSVMRQAYTRGGCAVNSELPYAIS